MRLPGALLLATVSAALLAAPAAARKAEHVPKPGYICTVGASPWESTVWINRTLDEQGVQLSAEMEWHAPLGGGLPAISATWRVEGDEPLAVNSGHIVILWNPIQPEEGRLRSKRWWLELSNTPEPPYWPRPAFSTGDKAALTPYISATWNDLAAYVRGSEHLYFSLRDERRVIQQRVDLEPTLFASGERAIQAALDRLEALSADFRSKCEHKDDVDPGEIVVI